jgi:hypothetical protein
VLVPEALAYASIAGVSPVVGLYAAPGALLLYAAFGSSRHLVTGPMSATAALSAAAVAEVATGGGASFAAHTAALAITTGLLALAAGLLRLGFLASFISEPVLKGFIIGLALTIIAGQLPDLLGVEGAGGDFFEKLWGVLGQLGQVSATTVAVGLASLALVLGLRRLAPMVPGSLVAVLLGDQEPEGDVQGGRPGQQPHHLPRRPPPGRAHHSSGSRRTSTSSRPSSWMRSSSPYRAAWSWIGPWSTVSTGSTDARMPSKAATSESLRRPLTRIS